MLKKVKKSVLHPDCPECGVTMEEVATDPNTGETEYECGECGETMLVLGNSPKFGRPTRN